MNMEMGPLLKRTMFKQALVVTVFITITGSLACNATPELNIEARVTGLLTIENRAILIGVKI